MTLSQETVANASPPLSRFRAVEANSLQCSSYPTCWGIELAPPPSFAHPCLPGEKRQVGSYTHWPSEWVG